MDAVEVGLDYEGEVTQVEIDLTSPDMDTTVKRLLTLCSLAQDTLHLNLLDSKANEVPAIIREYLLRAVVAATRNCGILDVSREEVAHMEVPRSFGGGMVKQDWDEMTDNQKAEVHVLLAVCLSVELGSLAEAEGRIGELKEGILNWNR